ncbi:MAG TPA: zinc-ribbon domain-containing protein, partial [Thermoplasmata archaeon]|nr:zinc-ribbon domain-containing protein [Thermoplasmata archaeon]
MSAAVCPRCGSANAPENRFCANCGNPMGALIGAAATPAPFAGPPPASWTGVPQPRSSMNGATIAIILVVVIVAAFVAAVALIYGLMPPGP